MKISVACLRRHRFLLLAVLTLASLTAATGAPVFFPLGSEPASPDDFPLVGAEGEAASIGVSPWYWRADVPVIVDGVTLSVLN